MKSYECYMVYMSVAFESTLLIYQTPKFAENNSWFILLYYFPLDETHLVVRRLIHYEVSTYCVNEESSSERHSYNRRWTDLLKSIVNTWVNTD